MTDTTEATDGVMEQTGDHAPPPDAAAVAHTPRRPRREGRRAVRRLRGRLRRWGRAPTNRFDYAPDGRNMPTPPELRMSGFREAVVALGPLERYEFSWFNELVDDAIRATADAPTDIRLEAAQEYLRRTVPVEREKRCLASVDRAERATEYVDGKDPAA